MVPDLFLCQQQCCQEPQRCTNLSFLLCLVLSYHKNDAESLSTLHHWTNLPNYWPLSRVDARLKTVLVLGKTAVWWNRVTLNEKEDMDEVILHNGASPVKDMYLVYVKWSQIPIVSPKWRSLSIGFLRAKPLSTPNQSQLILASHNPIKCLKCMTY